MKTEVYYAEIKKHLAVLSERYPEGYCHLTSVANRDKGTVDGSVTEVANDNAARCLAETTHRIATADEVAKWQEHQAINRQIANSTEYTLHGQKVVWSSR